MRGERRGRAVERARLPRLAEVAALDAAGSDFAASGGEDYELLLACPPDAANRRWRVSRARTASALRHRAVLSTAMRSPRSIRHCSTSRHETPDGRSLDPARMASHAGRCRRARDARRVGGPGRADAAASSTRSAAPRAVASRDRRATSAPFPELSSSGSGCSTTRARAGCRYRLAARRPVARSRARRRDADLFAHGARSTRRASWRAARPNLASALAVRPSRPSDRGARSFCREEGAAKVNPERRRRTSIRRSRSCSRRSAPSAAGTCGT